MKLLLVQSIFPNSTSPLPRDCDLGAVRERIQNGEPI